MSRLNSEMKNMKRTLILERAAEMFEQQGYEEMKVSVLAKEVGVSVGSIYAYFDSKEGLYSAWVLTEVEGAYELLLAIVEQELPFEEMIRRSIALKFKIIAKKRRSLASGVMNNPFFFESQQIANKIAFERLYSLYVRPIEQVKQVEIDTMQLVYILNAIGNAYVLRWIEGDIEDLEAKVDEVTTTFVRLVRGC